MSTKQTEALKLALDWYDSGNENPDDFANMIKQVIALAQQPAQEEPRGWQWLDTAVFRKKLPDTAEPGAWHPLYTSPQARETEQQKPVGHGGRPMTLRECMEAEEPSQAEPVECMCGICKLGKREPLTDEQIEDLYFDGFSISKLKEFARAIEAAHGIKGDA